MKEKENQQTPLRGNIHLVLMSRQAQRLVQGRSGHVEEHRVVPAIIGLFKFAAMLRLIWVGATKNDPYADFWMLKVDHALEKAQKDIEELRAQIDQAFTSVPGEVNVELARSPSPMELSLRFANPYAFTGAYLLGQYDNLVRQTLTARHVGIISHTEALQCLATGGRHMRRAYMSASGYRYLGLSREDMLANNARAEQAREQMGGIPEAIVLGTLRAPHAPPVLLPKTRTKEPDPLRLPSRQLDKVAEPSVNQG